MKTRLTSVFALVVSMAATSPAAAQESGVYHVVWDDFKQGFTADTPDARWLHFAVGSDFVADDGEVSTSAHGLAVTAKAFTKTMGQDTGWLSAFDRVKWLVIMNHFSSKGQVGFDALPGRELTCEATLSGQVYGTDLQPFGDAVDDPDSDPRLGAVASSAFDPATYMIFNFLLTNRRVYAFYEHAPFVRDVYGDYAAFNAAIPVMERSPGDSHHLAIAYDKAKGTVRWLVDEVEVFRVDAIGARIDRRYMLTDEGGTDMIFSPDQLDCAMGTFTFLDGYGPTQRGLVQLDADNASYVNPRTGGSLTFVDPASTLHDRLFGEGAAMQVERFVVSSLPAD